jgi:hypothetical protein
MVQNRYLYTMIPIIAFKFNKSIVMIRARDFMPLKTLKYVYIYALKNQ